MADSEHITSAESDSRELLCLLQKTELLRTKNLFCFDNILFLVYYIHISLRMIFKIKKLIR